MIYESNDPGFFGFPLSVGDFVQVHLNADPTKGHQGYVVEADETVICLQAHAWIGLNRPDDAPTCVDMPVLIPMASVAFVAQVKTRPSKCLCSEAVES